MATRLLQRKNVIPALLGLGILGALFLSRKKEEPSGRAEPKPLPLPIPGVNVPLPEGAPIPGAPMPLPPGNIPPGRIPTPTIPSAPGQSGFIRNPLFYSPGAMPATRYNPIAVEVIPPTDVTGNCKGNETWIPITDPRIRRYPNAPRILTRNGEGICVLTEFLPTF